MKRDMTYILPPPDKQEIEIEVSELFQNGDIKNIARLVQRDAGLVSKMLSANCDDKNNIVYLALLFMWAFDCTRPELGDAVNAIVQRERSKWNDRPAIVQSTARLSKNVGVEVAEFVECRMDGKDIDAQIKEAGDIEVAAAKLKANLIRERNAVKFPARLHAVDAVEERRSRRG